MSDLVRLLLLLGVAGSAVTLAGSAAAWWLDEERRLHRILRRALGATPDAAIVARGRQAGAAFTLDPPRALVVWNGGANALLYKLDRLLGAELIIDEVVAARVFRGEPRRALDATPAGAGNVALRLIFDDARDPDFVLDLWTSADLGRRNASPAAAVHEARRWLARAEAILRRPAPQPLFKPPPPEPEDEPFELRY